MHLWISGPEPSSLEGHHRQSTFCGRERFGKITLDHKIVRDVDHTPLAVVCGGLASRVGALAASWGWWWWRRAPRSAWRYEGVCVGGCQLTVQRGDVERIEWQQTLASPYAESMLYSLRIHRPKPHAHHVDQWCAVRQSKGRRVCARAHAREGGHTCLDLPNLWRLCTHPDRPLHRAARSSTIRRHRQLHRRGRIGRSRSWTHCNRRRRIRPGSSRPHLK